jgi:aspartyl-tRNA(Asn)/glutamyl-tRNA(Gln) amidotransferase subunit C
MALTHEDVRKIATLARLRFTPEEEAKLTGQLAGIVDYIDQLQAFEVALEGEDSGAVSQGAREVEDRPHECLPREELLANAPAALDAFLLVPEVKAEAGGGGHA